MHGKSVDWTELLIKATKKSSCKNEYRTSCKFYKSFFLHVELKMRVGWVSSWISCNEIKLYFKSSVNVLTV